MLLKHGLGSASRIIFDKKRTTMAPKPKPKQNLGKGSKVEEKKKNSTRGIGVITGVAEEALSVSLNRLKQWTVKWPDGTIESKTSAQLKRPVDKAADNACLVRDDRVAGKATAPSQTPPCRAAPISASTPSE